MFGPERGDFGKSCRPAGLTLLTGRVRGRWLVRHGAPVPGTALNGVPSASPGRIRRRLTKLPSLCNSSRGDVSGTVLFAAISDNPAAATAPPANITLQFRYQIESVPS